MMSHKNRGSVSSDGGLELGLDIMCTHSSAGVAALASPEARMAMCVQPLRGDSVSDPAPHHAHDGHRAKQPAPSGGLGKDGHKRG